MSALVVPRCTYTSPEIAQVGLHESELRERQIRFATLTVPLAENDRARLDGAPEGLLRLHYRRGSDRILGATLVSEHAGETIGELVVAIQHGVGLAQLAATIHPYPTQAEVVKRAADLWRRTKLTKGAKRLFAFWFRRQEKSELRRIASAWKGSSPWCGIRGIRGIRASRAHRGQLSPPPTGGPEGLRGQVGGHLPEAAAYRLLPACRSVDFGDAAAQGTAGLLDFGKRHGLHREAPGGEVGAVLRRERRCRGGRSSRRRARRARCSCRRKPPSRRR